MYSFNTDVSGFQTDWRKAHLKIQGNGTWNGKEYPWILPRALWEQSLWHGIRSDSQLSLPSYLAENNIQKHDGVHNLKSSWVLCANLYFPFRQDLQLIGGFLKQHVSSNIKTVDKIELEWAEESPLDPTTLLGEPRGLRGKNQTSPDVAFVVSLTNGGKGLILTESKFTEHSFYPCSGRKKEYGNPEPDKCMRFSEICGSIKEHCYQAHWANEQRTNRMYWDYITFSAEALEILRRCPAATSGYQLFRQQALAEAIAQKGNYKLVMSCVAYDARNDTLIRSLRGTGINDFSIGWAPLFKGQAKFATFTHQQWVDWVRQHNQRGTWSSWLEYINRRYGYG